MSLLSFLVGRDAQKYTIDAQYGWVDHRDTITDISTTWQNMQGGSSM